MLLPNTACTRSPATYAGAGVMGLPLRGVRVFKRFSWLGVDSDKIAFSRPAQPPVTPAVGRLSFIKTGCIDIIYTSRYTSSR
jgi:hypothetical protein